MIARALFVFSAIFSLGQNASAAMMAEEAEVNTFWGFTGSQLLVRGRPGPSQLFNRVKAVRCDRVKNPGLNEIAKNSCKTPIYFAPNEPADVEPGLYILGYENSIYPGFVEVKANQTTTVDLVRVEIPKNAAEAKVYRDFTRLSEQRKQYFAAWALGGAFFQQSEYAFGDYYLTQWPLRPAIPNLVYDYCERKNPSLSEESVDICKAWNSTAFIEMTDLFEFDTRGRFKQFWVGRPGGVFKFYNKRHLVSAPLKGGEFAAVFPGNYALEFKNAEGKTRTSQVPAGDTAEKYGTVPRHSLLQLAPSAGPAAAQPLQAAFDPANLAQSLTAEPVQTPAAQQPAVFDCSVVRLWKTEWRSYCRRDTDDGCARNQALGCSPMIDRGL